LAKPVTFVRDATGIVRGLSVWDVFLISAGGASLQMNFMWLFSWPDLTFPGSSPFWISTFALVIVIPIGLVYSLLGAAMPRSGGDYVYASRILRPDIGFMTSFVVGIAMFLTLGADIMYMVSTSIVPFFSVAGVLFNSPSLLALSGTISVPMNWFVIGVVIMILTVLVVMTRVMTATRITWIFMGLSILGAVITLGLLLVTSREAFISTWNAKMGQYATYDQLINTAKSLGWTPSTPNIWASLSAMPFGMWMFNGWIWPAYVGGEIKRASRSMILGIMVAVLFLWLFYCVVGELSWAVAGKDWISAVNWLATNYPDKYPVPSYPWLSFVAPLLTDNAVLIWVMLISYIAAWVVANIALTLCATRVLFAWSFDRVAPRALANVSDRLQAPTWAPVITGIFSIVALYVGIFTGIFGYFLNTAAFVLLTFAIVSVAAIVFPFRRKEIFKASLSMVRIRLGGVPLISILGVISLCFSIYGSYYALTNPVMGALTVGSYSMIAGVFTLGMIIYYVAKTYRLRKEGIDLGLLMKEIPPE
jgi:APA family basic amino acid/polyamine antiporter